jgi:hypothetical protein
MPSLKDTGDRFLTTLQIDNGQRIRASLWGLSDTNSDTSPMRRLMRVKPGTPVDPGDAVHSSSGQTWLVGEHGEASTYTVMKLFEANRKGTWERPTGSEDTVTGLQTSGSPTDNGQVYYLLEPAGAAEDQLNIPEAEYQLITNADVQEGDRVGGLTILRADELLGLRVCEARR